MRRRGRARRALAVPHPGDVVIDGHVRARLLGLHLLDLEAHIVVGSARPVPKPSAAETDGATAIADTGRAVDREALPLARAQRLVAEGSTVLADARRIR
jgi:hypothetical protein